MFEADLRLFFPELQGYRAENPPSDFALPLLDLVELNYEFPPNNMLIEKPQPRAGDTPAPAGQAPLTISMVEPTPEVPHEPTTYQGLSYHPTNE